VIFLLADSHCHLDSFKAPLKAIENARKAGVARILTASTGPESMQKCLSLAKKFPQVLCALGLHPSNILSMQQNEIERAIAFAEKNISNAAAIGEVGLDFKHAKTPAQRALQESVLREFIRLAMKNSLPVCVHARYAETRCLDILEEESARKVHMHWFTNSKKTASRAVLLGYFISCGPIIIHDSASAEVVKSIPLENLLLETDAPVPFGGRNSEPSWIADVCKKVAQIKGVSQEEVAKATGNNFTSLFGK